MFNINDYIMYGVIGVCKVVNVEENTINNTKKKYYVLNPIYSNGTTIKIPIDNDKIAMRKIISKEDVDNLIGKMPDKETMWIDDEKQRSEQYKTMLKSGECEELITLIKSIYLNKKHKKSMGEKGRKTDEEIMRTAEKLLNEEFATVLNIDLEDVKPYILSRVTQ